MVAFASGDLPGALRHLDDAAAATPTSASACPTRRWTAAPCCSRPLAGGRATGVEAALTGPVTATKKAELLLAAARIALAAGRHNQAAERSAMARSMFTAQHREWWRGHATFFLLQARCLARLAPAASSAPRAFVLLAALGPARLLELVAVDGDLHVLVCGDGRIRRLQAGAAAEATREVDFAGSG